MATFLQRIIRWHGPIWSAKLAAGRLLGVHPMNRYLRRVSGIIHVGANAGQEANLYARYGLDVLWIEPIPSIFDELRKNISALPKQRALNCLVTDRDCTEYTFNIANNDGQSSSILELGRHTEIWPGVGFQSKITLRSVTLDTLLGDEDRYQALVLDTQGSELLILKGATRLLSSRIQYVTTEAADFELYIGCPQGDDIVQFLSGFDFRLIQKHVTAESTQGGQCFNLLFRKR